MSHPNIALEQSGPFGAYLKYECPGDIVIVCSNDGCGLKPLALLLPHQVYADRFAGTPGLTLIPVRSTEYIHVSRPKEPWRPRLAGGD